MLLPGYWFTRHLHWRDRSRAGAVERPAVRLFLVIFAVQGAIQALAPFGPGIAAFGLDEGARGAVTGALVLLQTVATVYLSAWLVAWPLGNAAIGPVRSARIMKGGFWRTIGYVLAGVAPLTALHYALGTGAIGRPRGLVWAMLALDAVVVGYLALTLAGATVTTARQAVARKGVALAG